MSGLNKPSVVINQVIETVNQNTTIANTASNNGEDKLAIGGILIDPTLELSQPGGPAPYGHVVLTDGLGGYSIEPTLRPYLLGFRLPSQILASGSVYCEFHNVRTSKSGVVIPFDTTLIAIAVSVSSKIPVGDIYLVEVISDPTGLQTALASLLLNGKRKDFRRDLNIPIKAGEEIGVRVVSKSASDSVFDEGLITIELEA